MVNWPWKCTTVTNPSLCLYEKFYKFKVQIKSIILVSSQWETFKKPNKKNLEKSVNHPKINFIITFLICNILIRSPLGASRQGSQFFRVFQHFVQVAKCYILYFYQVFLPCERRRKFTSLVVWFVLKGNNQWLSMHNFKSWMQIRGSRYHLFKNTVGLKSENF